MHIVKMHGIGNDYVYVDCFNQPVPDDPSEVSKRISDRHFGVGGDGLILVCPSNKADARMRMFNADGSESEMCGNGVRCVAKFVHDRGLSKNNPLKIETGRGVLTLHLEVKAGKVEQVRVDMGEPILESDRIPTTLPGPRVVDVSLPGPLAELAHQSWADDCGLDPRITCVSMGNPHVVLYCKNVAKVPLEQVGPALENASVFPRRINVHFVQVHPPRPDSQARDSSHKPDAQARELPSEATMRTWERGSGITLACGTGACAVCVAGVLTGRTSRRLLAHLPGGDLRLEWSETTGPVYMTGPATEVFEGEWKE
jgi:diaminopimelate epimerase